MATERTHQDPSTQKVSYMSEDDFKWAKGRSVGILERWLERTDTTKLQALETMRFLSSRREDLKPITGLVWKMIDEEDPIG